MIHKIHLLYRRTTLTTKIILVTVSVGIIVWTAADFFATVTVENAFKSYLNETLREKAVDYRYLFARHVYAHRQAAKIFSTQKNLVEYILEQNWSPDDNVQVKFYSKPPVWLANHSILRSFITPRFALLADGQGRVREVYRSASDELPDFLNNPSDRLLKLSNNQNYLFPHAGSRYVVSSTSIPWPENGRPATLILASPIDEDFLLASQGSIHRGIIVAIVDAETQRVIASSDINQLPTGSTADQLPGHFLISEQEFFEYGSSDMDFRFISFISTGIIEPHIRKIVRTDRYRRAILAVMFIGAFTLIIIWITRRIGILTNRVEDFSRKTLGGGMNPDLRTGDQLDILEERFQLLTEEIATSHETIRLETEEKARILETGKAEAEKKELQEQLAQAQKMESVGRLAGGVAHDFNNILTAIIGHSDLALLTGISMDDRLKEHLSIIKESAERAAALTKQLLAFSRKQVLSMKPVNLTDLASNLAKMLKRLMGEDIVLQINSSSTQDIWADPNQMEQVLMNLAVNARDAMPDGGDFTIKISEQEIDRENANGFDGVNPGIYEKLVCHDTGTGIPPDVLANIFEPFFTTKGIGEGTGLGLATVYGVVKQHNGYIFVNSELEKGTSFTILLPVHEGEPVAPEETVPRELTGGDETILVVEDDPRVRGVIIKMLTPFGYTLVEAENGGEALQKCRDYNDRIDLLLTDVIMPGMNGRELADQVKKWFPEIKVIYMSGYTDDIISRHDIFGPQTIFISKPLTMQKVVGTIRDILDNR